MDAFWEDGLILRTLAGSRAHGLARADSDTDTRGVCIPPARFLLGLETFEQHESAGRDHVTFALAKFARLALQGNPNVLESLYVHEDDVLQVNEAGRALLGARDAFLSRRVGERFKGYALDQLARLERHARWLSDPPAGEPEPAAFGGAEAGGRARFESEAGRRAFEAAMTHWRNYRRWRRERNPERARLEERHGYDSKYAMHLMRLLRMGREVLDEGRLIVRRPDREWLLAVRDGALDYAQLLEQVNGLVAELDAARATSRLPEQPNAAAVQDLVIRLQRDALR